MIADYPLRTAGLLIMLSTAQALGAATSPASAPAADFDVPAMTKTIPHLLADEGVKPQDFHLTLKTGTPGGPMVMLMVAYSKGRVAILALNENGLPVQYATDGWAVSWNPEVPGGLIISKGYWPTLIFKPSASKVEMKFEVQSERKSSLVDIDLAANLVAMMEHSKSHQFDSGTRVLEVQTEHWKTQWELSSPPDAGGFPLEAALLQNENVVVAISGCAMDDISPLQLFKIRPEDIAGLHLLTKESVPEDVTGQKVMADPVTQRAASTLRTLFPEDPIAHRIAVAKKIAKVLDRALLDHKSKNMAALESDLVGIRSVIELEALLMLQYPAQGRADVHYSRKVAQAAVVALLTPDDMTRLIEELGAIAKDGSASEGCRFIALNLMGDMGVPTKTVDALDPELQTPELKALLTTVRVRLGEDVAKHRELLTAICEDPKAYLPIRLTCLEALCFDQQATMPPDVMKLLAQGSALALTSNVLEDLRYMSAVASTADGADNLLKELESPASPLKQSEIVGNIAQVVGRASPAFGKLKEICEKILVDPKAPEDVLEQAVYSVLIYGCSDQTTATFTTQSVAAHDAKRVGLGLHLIRRTDHTLQFMPQISDAYDRGDTQQQIYALSSICALSFPAGGDCAPALPVLKRGMASDQSVVRGVALRTVAELKQHHAKGPEAVLEDVKARALAATELNESRIALFTLEAITDGAFKIGDDPRDKDGWLMQGATADLWWKEHIDQIRLNAAEWAKAH